MESFFKTNRTFFTYSLIFLIVVPIFGFNIFISIVSNILILLILLPILLLLIAFISFNTLKSKVKICNQCGSITLSSNNTCFNCGADISNKDLTVKEFSNPSESTIEVKAEEIE